MKPKNSKEVIPKKPKAPRIFSTIEKIRIERLRPLIEKYGTTGLAMKLGYRHPSFLTQMAGPNPDRPITEKTARRFEKDLGLPDGFLDQPAATQDDVVTPDEPTPAANTALVADVIRLVGTICSVEGIDLPPAKFADIVALAYVDTIEHNSSPREDHIKQIVRLLK